MTEQRTMIATAAYVALARSLAEGIAGEPGAGMWITELSANGQAPASHYISSGHIAAEMAALLGDAQATYDAAGGQVPLADIQALYDASTIVADLEPAQVHALIASLGLQMVRREL